MDKKKFWSRFGRTILLVGAILIGVLIVWLVFGDMIPEMIQLLRNGNEDEIEAFLAKVGHWKGYFAVMVLSALQVISIVFPGFAIQISAGIIFGTWRAFICCYLGFLFGNMLVFLVARRMGDNINSMIGGKKKDSALNQWIKDKMKSTKPGFVVAFVNLLPILPNGIIPYIAAGTSIRALHYLCAIAVSCWIQMLFNCAAGYFLMKGQYLYMVLALSIQIVILIVVTVKRQWVMSLMPGKTVGEVEAEKREAEEKAAKENSEPADGAEKAAVETATAVAERKEVSGESHKVPAGDPGREKTGRFLRIDRSRIHKNFSAKQYISAENYMNSEK